MKLRDLIESLEYKELINIKKIIKRQTTDKYNYI